MKIVKILIEKNEDGFWAHATNYPSINGYGETVEECKKNALEGIEVAKQLEGRNKFPLKDGDYSVVFNFDIPSLFENYKGILSNPAFEKLTGINQKQIHHYATGHKKPRLEQRMKIQKGLHKFAEELAAIELD